MHERSFKLDPPKQVPKISYAATFLTIVAFLVVCRETCAPYTESVLHPQNHTSFIDLWSPTDRKE
jgi:hypothetical protein